VPVDHATGRPVISDQGDDRADQAQDTPGASSGGAPEAPRHDVPPGASEGRDIIQEAFLEGEEPVIEYAHERGIPAPDEQSSRPSRLRELPLEPPASPAVPPAPPAAGEDEALPAEEPL